LALVIIHATYDNLRIVEFSIRTHTNICERLETKLQKYFVLKSDERINVFILNASVAENDNRAI